jgi:hydroxyacylglutathione hydrolase
MKYSIIPVTPFQQNCTLIWCEETNRAAVVDPGGDLELIQARIDELGVVVEKILLTHAHIDHAGGTHEFSARHGIPVEGPHRGDLFWIEGLDQQSRMFGFPQVESFTPDRWLDDADVVQVGNQQLQVLHCPGHTPGHVVFYHQGAELALVGDVLFHGSIGRTDFPQGNHQHLIDSIRTKLLPLGDEVAFIPGHGPMSTFGEERRNNPFVSDKRYG